jgi:hypothetical protein
MAQPPWPSRCACVPACRSSHGGSYVVSIRGANRVEPPVAAKLQVRWLIRHRQALDPERDKGSDSSAATGLTSVSTGQPGDGAPRRNRTGDVILTMDRSLTAVPSGEDAGWEPPQHCQLWNQFRRPCADPAGWTSPRRLAVSRAGCQARMGVVVVPYAAAGSRTFALDSPASVPHLHHGSRDKPVSQHPWGGGVLPRSPSSAKGMTGHACLHSPELKRGDRSRTPYGSLGQVSAVAYRREVALTFSAVALPALGTRPTRN